MKEDESNWFSKWEQELPSPQDLMPLSQTLITPDLALAFNIQNNHNNGNNGPFQNNNFPPHNNLSPQNTQQPISNSGGDFESTEMTGNNSCTNNGGGGDGEPARTLKRPRLVWTPQLHKRFVDAVAHLGIKNAVPKTIMQLMSVDGLTRENVASHLQKYRLYLKRMQGLSSGGSGSGSGDPATDHLFASSPVPAHFLHPGRANSDHHYMPYVPPVAAGGGLHHHQQQQIAAAAAAVAAGHHHGHMQHHQQLQTRYGQIGHFGSPRNGQFEHQHSFLNRQNQQQQPVVHRMMNNAIVGSSYVDDLESANGSRKVLTLFPNADD